MAHHFYALVAPAAVMRSKAPDSLTASTHFVSLYITPILKVFFLVLRIPGLQEHSCVIVEHHIGPHVEDEGDVEEPPPGTKRFLDMQMQENVKEQVKLRGKKETNRNKLDVADRALRWKLFLYAWKYTGQDLESQSPSNDNNTEHDQQPSNKRHFPSFSSSAYSEAFRGKFGASEAWRTPFGKFRR